MNNFSSILRNQIASQLRQLRVDKNLSISNIALMPSSVEKLSLLRNISASSDTIVKKFISN